MAKKKKSKGKKAKARPKTKGAGATAKLFEKAATKFGRAVISENEKPFADADKLLKITLHTYAPPKNYRELLTEDEVELLKKAFPKLTKTGLEAVLRRVYLMGDERIKRVTLQEIFDFAEDYLSSRQGQQRTTAGGGKAASNTPVTLREFFREYCEPLSENLLESRVKALRRLNLRKEKGLTPPLERIGEREKGKSDKYLPSVLIKNWSQYQKQQRTLPPLKSV